MYKEIQCFLKVKQEILNSNFRFGVISRENYSMANWSIYVQKTSHAVDVTSV